MNDTPETDEALSTAECESDLVIRMRRMERERDEARFDLDFRRRLGDLQNKTIDDLTKQRDEAVNNYESAQLLSVRVGEQRDEWKAKYIQQNKDLGHELRDPNGTIWSECKRLQTELTAVTEQRDKLIKAIEPLEYWRDISDCDCSNPLPQGGCLRCDLERILKLTNPNEEP